MPSNPSALGTPLGTQINSSSSGGIGFVLRPPNGWGRHKSSGCGRVVSVEIGVKEVAAQLGVTERRVRQLIEAGDLPARRVSGRLLVEEAGIPRSRAVARPMSPRIAWAFIHLLSREPIPDISDRELARLETKYRTLL